MNHNFFKYWFSGLQTSLEQMDESSRNLLLKECGRACSNSYTRQVYIHAWKNAHNEEKFIQELKNAFSEIAIEVLEKGYSYLITYRYCACDLVKEEYINFPYQCECSRNSLLYNWEAILGEGKVKVELIQSILSGAPCCQFKVTIL